MTDSSPPLQTPHTHTHTPTYTQTQVMLLCARNTTKWTSVSGRKACSQVCVSSLIYENIMISTNSNSCLQPQHTHTHTLNTAKLTASGRAQGITGADRKVLENTIPGFKSWLTGKFTNDLNRARKEVCLCLFATFLDTHTHTHS